MQTSYMNVRPEWGFLSITNWGENQMTKLKTLTAIATIFALSSTFAMAQNGAASPKIRSASTPQCS